METSPWPPAEPDISTQAVLLKDGAPAYAKSRMTGWLERQEFHPMLSAFLLFVVSFLLFQGLASLIAVVMVLTTEGFETPESVLDVLEHATVPLLTGNTLGQFLGMALPVFLWTRLHTRETGNFLRFKAPDAILLVLAVVGLVALLPGIQWLGQMNETVPLPRFLVELERAQIELIERILGGDIGLGATVFALAVTPAFCEEVLFRGYLQRQFERAAGVAGGIVLTGLLFGLYHFRLSQAVPLAVLGIFLGYVVWRTGSIWVPIVIHFVNNAFAIAANSYVASNPDIGIADIDAMRVPFTVLAGGTAIFIIVIMLMNKRVRYLSSLSDDVEVIYG